MDNKTTDALRSLGLEISEIQYKYPSPDHFSMGDAPTKFMLKGEFYNEAEIKRLLEEVIILRKILKNKHPAVKDLYEKLKTASGITNG